MIAWKVGSTFAGAGLLVSAVIADPVPDRDAQPIRPPVPSYPPDAAQQGIQGRCIGIFFVDEEGHTFNIQVSCTNGVFCSETKRALSRVLFAPKIVDGEAAIRENVVYPIEYALSEWNQETQAYISQPGFPENEPLAACDQVAVS